MTVLWLLIACGASPEVPVPPPSESIRLIEVFDVPPPPGTRTLQTEIGWAPELGVALSAEGPGPLVLDVVDVRPAGTRFEVTAYVPEDQADLALQTDGWRIRRP